MAYTVRRVSGLSGVSIRTLQFHVEENLLELQQILFYLELGLDSGRSGALWGGPILKRRPMVVIKVCVRASCTLESHRGAPEQKRQCDEDEWIYAIEGELMFAIGARPKCPFAPTSPPAYNYEQAMHQHQPQAIFPPLASILQSTSRRCTFQ